MGYNEPRRYFTLSSSNHQPTSSTVALPPTPPMAEGNSQQQQQHVSDPTPGGGAVSDHNNHPPSNDAVAAQGQQHLQLQNGANGVGVVGQQQQVGTNANLAASGMNLFGGQALNLGAGHGVANGGIQAQQQLGVAGLLSGGNAGLNQSSLNQLVAGFNQHNSQLQAANQAGQQAAAQAQAQGQLGLHGQATVDLDQLVASIQAQQQAQQRTVVQAALARAFPGGAAGNGAGGLGGLAGGLGGFQGSFNVGGGGSGLQQQLLLSQLQQQGGGGIDLLGNQLGGQQRGNEQLLAQLGQKLTGLPGRESAGLKSDGALPFFVVLF